jgi:hypothetical protein
VLVRHIGRGQGLFLRVLLLRERFARALRVYGIDQDEQQEYVGRFCDYLGGSRVPIRTPLEAEEFVFRQLANPRRRGLGPARVRRTRPRRYLRCA